MPDTLIHAESASLDMEHACDSLEEDYIPAHVHLHKVSGIRRKHRRANALSTIEEGRGFQSQTALSSEPSLFSRESQ